MTYPKNTGYAACVWLLPMAVWVIHSTKRADNARVAARCSSVVMSTTSTRSIRQASVAWRGRREPRSGLAVPGGFGVER